MASSCPTKVKFEELLTGAPSSADSAALDEHLAECAACRQTLSVLAGGNESWLRQNLSHGTVGVSSQLESAINRLKRSDSAVKLEAPQERVGAGVPPRFLGDYGLLEE